MTCGLQERNSTCWLKGLVLLHDVFYTPSPGSPLSLAWYDEHVTDYVNPVQVTNCVKKINPKT